MVENVIYAVLGSVSGLIISYFTVDFMKFKNFVALVNKVLDDDKITQDEFKELVKYWRK